MVKTIKKILISLCLVAIVVKLVLITAIFLYPKIISQDNIEANAKELIQMTNDYRRKNNLNELKPNSRLTQAAVNKAGDLLNKQYFSHTSPDGKRFSWWIKDVDYQYFYVGENLAIDFANNQDIFKAWLDSPLHKENILKAQYQEIGIAVVEGKYKNHQTVVAVQLFGSRVSGDFEDQNALTPTIPGLADNYFLNQNFWQKTTSLKNLEKFNLWTNYSLAILIGLYLIAYAPLKRKNQINIKQPIINRYQAKIFRE